MVPDGLNDRYSSDKKVLTPWVHFVYHMEREATKRKPVLGEQGKTADLSFVRVHPDYRGNKIANSMVRAILPLCKKAGFKYAAIEATNFFTSKVAALNNFEEVYSINAKDYE